MKLNLSTNRFLPTKTLQRAQAILRYLIGFSIVLVFLLPATGKLSLPFIQQLENQMYDFRLNLTKPDTSDHRVVIVDIDEKSLKQEGRWPWGRDKLANMMDILFDDYQIAIAGFDVLFAEPDNSSGLGLLQRLESTELAGNQEFKQVLSQLTPELEYDRRFELSLVDRPVVLGYFFQNEFNHGDANLKIGKLPNPVDTDQELASKLPLINTTGFGANLENLQQAAASGGFIDPLVDEDGIIRRISMIKRFNGQLYESLSLAVVRTLLGNPPLSFVTTDSGKDIVSLEKLDIAGIQIPVDKSGNSIIPYRGTFPNTFTYVSATDVLNGKVAKEILQDAIVLVGTTSAGLFDMRATPVQNIFPGVEIHANMIVSIFDGSIQHRPYYAIGGNVAMIILIGLIMNFLFPRMNIAGSVIATIGLFAIAISSNIYLWQIEKLDFPIVSQVLLVLFLFMHHAAYGYFVENRNKRELAKAFSQYIPPELVEDLSHNPEDLALGGSSREMSVLFTDIRDFTQHAESLAPQRLTRMMNQYFTTMTEKVLTHRGTIDKYIGDAMMAFWGAPINDKDHARHAMQAALAMHAALPELNQRFQSENLPVLKVGIGINAGKMYVGNMGSEFRMAYTVLGDAVNLASRLEALCKRYGVPIVVSDSVKSAAPEFLYQELDLVRVKGRQEPIRIYRPHGIKEELPGIVLQEIEQYQKMLAYYRNRDWKKAQSVALALLNDYDGKLLYQEYLGRAVTYSNNPPEDNWDGVYTHLSK